MTRRQSRPSLLRALLGVVLVAAAIATAFRGLSALNDALIASGHGSAEVRTALIWLGAAGGGLGAGVSLLIWEFAVRFGEGARRS